VRYKYGNSLLSLNECIEPKKFGGKKTKINTTKNGTDHADKAEKVQPSKK
jgi:hypothetical protein